MLELVIYFCPHDTVMNASSPRNQFCDDKLVHPDLKDQYYVITAMSESDNANPLSSSPERRGFRAVDILSAKGESLGDILSRVLQHEEAGVPLIVRGLDADPRWSPSPLPKERGGGEGQPPGRFENPLLSIDLIWNVSSRI
jgi:hypothetical protein